MKRVILSLLAGSIVAAFGNANAQSLQYVWSGFWGGMNEMCAVGNYVYCAYYTGLQIFDVSNPGHPAPVSQLYFQGYGRGICVAGSYAYLADDSAGLQIIDISNPSAPFLVGNYDGPGAAYDVVVRDNYAYLTNGYQGGLSIINVSDPANPTPRGFLSINGIAGHIALYNEYACVSQESSSVSCILTINISNSTNPVRAGIYYMGDNDVPSVSIYDHYVLTTASRSGLRIIDISDPVNPHLKATILSGTFFCGLAAIENYAFALSSFSLNIIDLSDLAHPSLIREYNVGDRGLCTDGQNLFVGSVFSRFTVLDISDPVNPALRGCYDHDWEVTDVQKVGDYAYVTTGYSGGLQILDVSNPSHPVNAAIINKCDEYISAFVSGNYAYVVNFSCGFDVVNISDPYNPALAGSIRDVYGRGDIFVDGDYAYLTQYSRLAIANVADPANPTNVRTYQLPQDNYCTNLAIAVSGGYAFVGTSDSGLVILNVQDPRVPSLVSRYHMPRNRAVNDLCIVGNYIFLASEDNGAVIVDIQDPAHPRRVSACPETNGSTIGVCVDSSFAYLSNNWGGAQVFDISDITSPVLVSSYWTPIYAGRSDVSGEYLYLADQFSLMILRMAETGITDGNSGIPEKLDLSQNYPNPFNAHTTIRYSMPKASDVSIEIFDITGRKIQTLQDGFQQAGEHSIVWNAEDRASGVYFYRLKAGRIEKTEKCVLLK